jgi:tryptophan synthase alpha chain
MSDRYKLRFQKLRESGRKVFMPFTLLGWPDRERSLALIKQMIESGASALELGFAFSDPVADGPIIQQAAFETIDSGFSLLDAFKLLAEVRKLDWEIPIGVLVYYNLVIAQGVQNFFVMAKEAGVDGVLIADLPVDNADEITQLASGQGIATIYLVSPVSPEHRVRLIARQAHGFIYLLSRLGVTGTASGASAGDERLTRQISLIKKETTVPVCTGFGISSGETAARMFAAGADGVITGSKVIELARMTDGRERLQVFYAEMLAACQSGAPATSRI